MKPRWTYVSVKANGRKTRSPLSNYETSLVPDLQLRLNWDRIDSSATNGFRSGIRQIWMRPPPPHPLSPTIENNRAPRRPHDWINFYWHGAVHFFFFHVPFDNARLSQRQSEMRRRRLPNWLTLVLILSLRVVLIAQPWIKISGRRAFNKLW